VGLILMLEAQHHLQLGLIQLSQSAHSSNNSSSRAWQAPSQWQGSIQGAEAATLQQLMQQTRPAPTRWHRCARMCNSLQQHSHSKHCCSGNSSSQQQHSSQTLSCSAIQRTYSRHSYPSSKKPPKSQPHLYSSSQCSATLWLLAVAHPAVNSQLGMPGNLPPCRKRLQQQQMHPKLPKL
jgi:exopolyphosphatase/pppGpp-phosphohydrolase